MLENTWVSDAQRNQKARWKAIQTLLASYRQGVPLQPYRRVQACPLSLGQERLWLLHELGADTRVYHLPFAFWLAGDLNIVALEASLQEIVRRHDILRTTFSGGQGQPMQVVAPELAFRLPVVDLQALPPAEQEEQYQQIVHQEIERPFDLGQLSLWRLRLIRLGVQKYVLLLTAHHIIYDSWSHNVFTTELSTLYGDVLAGRRSSLSKLPIQYGDFAQWQRQWLTGEVLRSQQSYWQQQLSGDLLRLRLPYDRQTNTDEVNHQGKRQPVSLSPALTTSLQALSDRQGVTLFVVLLAAFNLLLYQYTGQKDLMVCSTQAGRNLSQLQGLIGFFNNIVPLRTNLGGNPSFLDLINQVHQTTLGAYQHQDMPLQLLAEGQNLARKGLYQVMLILQNMPEGSLNLPGLTVEAKSLSNGTANFDLFLSLNTPSSPNSPLVGYLEYQTRLFSDGAIARLLEDFQTLLTCLVENPDQTLADLPLAIGSLLHKG